MDSSELTRRIAAIFDKFSAVQFAYLFGSQVGGAAGPLSDIDLGILVERGGDDMQVQAQLSHELAVVAQPLKTDVVLLHRAPVELAYAVIAQGVCVYQRDTLTRVEYEADVLSRYGDYLPVMRAQRQAILEEDAHDRRVQRYREALGRTERALGQIRAAQE
jgi:predicted nucleotidyltransferase